MKQQIYLLLFLGFGLAACEQPVFEPRLPDLTMEGKNTFGCRVNGEVWLPFRKETNSPSRYASFSAQGLSILAGQWDGEKDEWISLIAHFEQAKDTTYSLGSNVSGLGWGSYQDGSTVFFTDEELNGKLHIVAFHLENDGKHRFIAGTFEFTARDASGQLVEVTDGRFDLRLDP